MEWTRRWKKKMCNVKYTSMHAMIVIYMWIVRSSAHVWNEISIDRVLKVSVSGACGVSMDMVEERKCVLHSLCPFVEHCILISHSIVPHRMIARHTYVHENHFVHSNSMIFFFSEQISCYSSSTTHIKTWRARYRQFLRALFNRSQFNRHSCVHSNR